MMASKRVSVNPSFGEPGVRPESEKPSAARPARVPARPAPATLATPSVEPPASPANRSVPESGKWVPRGGVSAFEMVPEKRVTKNEDGTETVKEVLVSRSFVKGEEEPKCRGCGKPKPSMKDGVSGFRWCFACWGKTEKCVHVKESGATCGARITLAPCAACGAMKCAWCHEGHKCKLPESKVVVDHRVARSGVLCDCGSADVALLMCGAAAPKPWDKWRCSACGKEDETACVLAADAADAKEKEESGSAKGSGPGVPDVEKPGDVSPEAGGEGGVP